MFKYKAILLVLLLAIGFAGFEAVAQSEDFTYIARIIKSGNAKDLTRLFHKTVELNIDGKEASYSQAQAEAVLKEFFNKSAPQSFTINHKGASKGGLPYAIGEYTNGMGVYRVWIRLKPAGNRNLVYEMSFIKE